MSPSTWKREVIDDSSRILQLMVGTQVLEIKNDPYLSADQDRRRFVN